MPIIRSSSQSSKSLQEFYRELTEESTSIIDHEIGIGMLSFLEMVDAVFVDTLLYGLTSHYALVIQATDNWADSWFVKVRSAGNEQFQFQYAVPEAKSPWKDAAIIGEANNIDEARKYLIIAMTESEGWKQNSELHKLYTDMF